VTALAVLDRSQLGGIVTVHAVNHLEDHDHLVTILGDDGQLIPDSDHRAIYAAAIELGRTKPACWARSWAAPRNELAARTGNRRGLDRLGTGLDPFLGDGIAAAHLLVRRTRARRLAAKLAHMVYALNNGADPDAVQRRLEELSHATRLEPREHTPGVDERQHQAELRAALPPPPVPRRRPTMETAA
jgi:hypothetical protein